MLKIQFQHNENEDRVKSKIGLPKTVGDVSVTWVSSGETVIKTGGKYAGKTYRLTFMSINILR